MSNIYARLGAAAYAAWGIFHIYVAWQIYALGFVEQGIARGRLLQLAHVVEIALQRVDLRAQVLEFALYGNQLFPAFGSGAGLLLCRARLAQGAPEQQQLARVYRQLDDDDDRQLLPGNCE